MDLNFIASVIVPIIALPILSVIGWFLRTSFIAIKKDIEKIIEKINTFQLTITKIDMTISSIEKDMEKANNQLEKTNSLAYKNFERLNDQAHQIKGVQNNMMMIIKSYDELEKRVIDLESNEKSRKN